MDNIAHNDDSPVKDRSIDTYIDFIEKYIMGLRYDGKEEKGFLHLVAVKMSNRNRLHH